MADRRKKNVQWSPAEASGQVPTWERANLAVLMDIRDELQSLNATLNCHNTRDIPRILRQIRAHTANLPKTGKKGCPRTR